MLRQAVLLSGLFLAGCGYSPAKYAITVNEPMTWHVSKDRGLMELRYALDPRFSVTICSEGVLERVEKLGKRKVSVEHRVWRKWPWSGELHGFNPERVEGSPIHSCSRSGQVSSFRGNHRPGHNPRHPLERHLRR